MIIKRFLQWIIKLQQKIVVIVLNKMKVRMIKTKILILEIEVGYSLSY
jgi:hypothetical protein